VHFGHEEMSHFVRYREPLTPVLIVGANVHDPMGTHIYASTRAKHPLWLNLNSELQPLSVGRPPRAEQIGQRVRLAEQQSA
jgi:hypothetical protein